LHILDIHPSLAEYFANTFSQTQSKDGLFALVSIFFIMQKLHGLIPSHLPIFAFVA
jgi:hypothetical protein